MPPTYQCERGDFRQFLIGDTVYVGVEENCYGNHIRYIMKLENAAREHGGVR